MKWDGVSRISNALHHFLGADKSILVAESLKVFMLGAVSRIFNPGCKFELMLCLVGGQGAGKSTFLRFLAMNDLYFTDDIKKLDDKVFEHIQTMYPQIAEDTMLVTDELIRCAVFWIEILQKLLDKSRCV